MQKEGSQESKEVGNKEAKAYGDWCLASYKGAFDKDKEFYDHHQSCHHIADVALQESLNNVLEKDEWHNSWKGEGDEGIEGRWDAHYPYEPDLLQLHKAT